MSRAVRRPQRSQRAQRPNDTANDWGQQSRYPLWTLRPRLPAGKLCGLPAAGGPAVSCLLAAVAFVSGCGTVESRVADLKHPDVRVRERAALKLGRSGQEAVAPIVSTLLEEEPEYRERAFYVLGSIGPKASGAVTALGAALRSEDAPSRRMAAWALGQIGKASLGEIEKGLRHEDPEVRVSAVRSLGFVGPKAKSLVPELARMMREGDPAARITAAEAAGRIGPRAKAAVPALVKLVQGETLTEAAARSVGEETGEETGGETGDESAGEEIRERNREASGYGTADVRAAALEALGLIGGHAKRAVPEVAKLLVSRDPAVRAAAARTLGKIGPHASKAAAILGKTLADENADVRRESLLALVGIGSVPRFAVGDFLGALRELQQSAGGSPEAERRTARVLEGFRRELAPVLVDLAKESDPAVRARAVWALGMMPPRLALPTVVRALEDGEAAVRLEAVRALSRAGPAARGSALAVGMTLKDPDPAVRKAAAEAVGRILEKE